MSLVPWLRAPKQRREKPAIIVEETGHIAVRSSRYRYIRYKNGEEELYDHLVDPKERTNLAGSADWKRVKQTLAAHLPDTNAKAALTKKAYKFDPHAYTWTNKKSGERVEGSR